MADLTRNSADLPIVIIGATTTGVPTTPVGSDTSGNLLVNVATTAPPNNLLSTGILTSGASTVSLTLQGTASVNIDVSGPGFVGTIVVFESTPSQQRNLGVFALNASAIAPSITANGNYRVSGVPTSGSITVQFSSYTSGSATINIYGSTAPYIVQPYSANAANVLVTSYLNDGSGNSISSSNSQLYTADVINTAITTGALSVSTTAVAARVGASNLANRKVLTLTPTNGIIYLGATSAVTTATGIPIAANQTAVFSFTASITPFVIASTTTNVIVLEGS